MIPHSIIDGIVTRSYVKNGELSLEFQLSDGFLCMLTFETVESQQILSTLINNPGHKDPKKLIDKQFRLLEHPGGGTLSPIAMEIQTDEKHFWIYKKKGDWERWM